MLGRRVWRGLAVRAAAGSLSWRSFREFLPTGGRFQALCGLAVYVGWGRDFTVCLVLEPQAIRAAGLGSGDGPRLGWTAFLRTTRVAPCAAEIRLRPAHG
jgi:predicted component of type VI protein secretion system